CRRRPRGGIRRIGRHGIAPALRALTEPSESVSPGTDGEQSRSALYPPLLSCPPQFDPSNEEAKRNGGEREKGQRPHHRLLCEGAAARELNANKYPDEDSREWTRIAAFRRPSTVPTF